MPKDSGFSLVEVLIGLAVVSVLAAISVPAWGDLENDADVAALKAEVSATAQYLYVYEVEGGLLPYPQGSEQSSSVESLLGFAASHSLSVFGSGYSLCVEGNSARGETWSYAIFGGLRPEPCVESTPPVQIETSEPEVTVELEPVPEPEASPDAFPALTNVADRGQWGHAMFTHGDIQLTNGVTVTGGAIYSPGSILCNSNSRIAGFAVAERFEATNNCSVNAVWVNGDVKTSASPVLGDVYARGGVVAANSTVVLSGNVYVGRTASASDGGALTFGGGYYPGVDVPPVPQYLFPQVEGETNYWEGKGYEWRTWGEWLDGQARLNGAPSWVSFINDPCKQVTQATWSVNGPIRSPSTPTVLDARQANGCNVTFSGGNELILNSDLTIIVDSLSGSGAFTVTSGTGTRHVLRIIAPWPTEYATCADIPANHRSNISLAGAGMRFSAETPTLLYSPSRVSLSNDVQGSGAVYGCSLSLSNDVVWNLDAVAP